ncbi:septal ring lytic transglycosylase RlpA family protein [Solimicrobium silvestre]|uniref:Endolytic peptidoglycan transglycosylase RlpA n=1 Tax=Solimicrobium silvestre TaxID=2099400 RepID=A0A2S9GZV1_9BURK|nr:septal ring lytic transglycosylase RlpA family protein [Solimicrobium silvestre]PRC93265.1 rlpA: rare lipoprotein A [Solimicrobium silvestre]
MHSLKSRSQLVAITLLGLLLAACGSAPKVAAPSSAGSTNSTKTSSIPSAAGQPAPNLPKAGSGRGAYYKDDGPGENPPPGLELTLDAEPKLEPYSVSGNKPYVVFGKTYTPMIDDRAFSQRGTGSWYGKKFHGQRTSSGELYDMYKMTAAHPTLPIPSYARITNISNGRQVIVKINDRGPFHTNRIVDLSYTAALKLDYLGKGSSELLLERLLPADIEKMAENKKNNVGDKLASAPPPVVTSIVAPTVVVPVIAEQAAAAPVRVVPAATDTASFEALVATHASSEDVAQVPVVISTPNNTSGFYLQFGAFGLRSNAEATFTHLQSKLKQLPAFEIVQQGTLYRLFSGPFASRDEANNALQLAMSIGIPKPVIVQR